MSHKKYSLAIFALHPIQYQAPLWKRLYESELIDTMILFGDRVNLEPYWEPEFQDYVDFNLPLLEGYDYKFISNFTFDNKRGFTKRLNLSLIKELSGKKYDTILVHGYDTASAWLALFVAKFTSTKLLFRGEAVLSSHAASWKARIKKRVLSFFLAQADVVFFSCSGNRDYFEYYGVPANKFFSFPCAVDNLFFQQERKKWLAYRKKTKIQLGISEDDLVVIFVARLTQRKRPLDLVRAMRKLNGQGHNNITALFVGDGPEKDTLEEAAKQWKLDDVRFVGFQNHTLIGKYYAIADVGVVLSDYDPSPKAMNEMMNFAIPIICTDVVGTAQDLVKNNENGFIVKVGDVETIANHIQELAEERGRARRMGEKSLEIVSEWNFDRDVEAIEAAVEYVMGNSQSS